MDSSFDSVASGSSNEDFTLTLQEERVSSPECKRRKTSKHGNEAKQTTPMSKHALHLDPYYISKKRRVLISEAQKALNISEQEVTAAIGPPNYDLIFHDIPMAQRKKAIELVENDYRLTAHSQGNDETPERSRSNRRDHGRRIKESRFEAEILARIGQLEDLVKTSMRKQDEILEKFKADMPKDAIAVPFNIRQAVRDAYGRGVNTGKAWKTDEQTKLNDPVNDEMNNYIQNAVLGLYTDTSMDVLQAACKRYFISKREEQCRQRKNNNKTHRDRQVKYERKKEKSRRRIKALAVKKSFSQEKRERVAAVLNAAALMSTDESADEDGFISHSKNNESQEWADVKVELDRKFLKDVASARSKKQMARRQKGQPKTTGYEISKLSAKQIWIIKDLD